VKSFDQYRERRSVVSVDRDTRRYLHAMLERPSAVTRKPLACAL